MAKGKKNASTVVADPPAEEQPIAAPVTAPAPPTAPRKSLAPGVADYHVVTIDVPLADEVEGTPARHIDMQLTPQQGEVLNRFMVVARGKKLNSGRIVDGPVKALMLILEGLGDAEQAAQTSAASES
jgi:hypothetical protein